MKRWLSILMLTVLIVTISVPAAADVKSMDAYSDVPVSHWAVSYIEAATDAGLMEGIGNDEFGLGQDINRASFVTILCRLFGWTLISPDTPSFADCDSGDWYYQYIETALEHGAFSEDFTFRPEDPISREEMAVMLVSSLGYSTLAESLSTSSPFPDVTSNAGYITIAYRIGMINGIETNGVTKFYPSSSATREQAAAMLVRIYDRYTSSLDWLHGFYALSSYSQIDLTADMDAVSLGWSLLTTDESGTPWLNTTSSGGNSWAVPSSSETAIHTFESNGTHYNLNVFCTDSSLLDSALSRAAAVTAIVTAANDYGGITIDYEGLFSADKENFTAFMTTLREALPSDKSLYVCVCPVVLGQTYYDGYDYRALGTLCDKVILMAHDYQSTSVSSDYLGTSSTNTPLTPFKQIYAALVAITDEETGVEDRSKIALALSFTGVSWEVDSNGLLLSQTAFAPSIPTIYTRLTQSDTVIGWSDVYQNPFAKYTTDNGSHYYLMWYEDARSVAAKIELARMFGITGVSLWRIGTIPNGDANVYWNVWSTLLSYR